MAQHGDVTMTENVEKVLVTAGPKAPPNKRILETPPGDHDVQVIVMGWARQALIRSARTFIQTFLSALGVAGVGEAAGPGQISPADFWDHAGNAALVALIAAFIAFAWNASELLAKLDNPETRA